MPILDCGFPGTYDPEAEKKLAFWGPTLWVDVGFDLKVHSGSRVAPPESQIKNVPALLDTGARESCIDDNLAQKIGLPVIDQQTVSGVGGSLTVNVYLGHIHIPALNYIQRGNFSGVLLTDGGQEHVALLGRSMLQDMQMVYNGLNGTVTLSM